MATVITESREELVEQVSALIREKLADQAEPVVAFAQQFLHQYPLEDLAGRRLVDVYGCIYTWWNFIQQRPGDKPKVRVFNPRLEDDGWQCSHTVVGVLQRDMPFLVDSVRIEINRRDTVIHSIKSTVMRLQRDPSGKLEKLLPPCRAGLKEVSEENAVDEALVYVEINLDTSRAYAADLSAALTDVLGDVELVVDDYVPMLDTCSAMEDQLRAGLGGGNEGGEDANLQEACAFLQWMRDGNFTFLGYREYEFCQQGEKKVLCEVEKRRLGIFKKLQEPAEPTPETAFNEGKQKFYQGPNFLTFAKSSVKSRVHRAAYSDYVTIKRYNAKGEVIGESAFMGLYTSPVYTESPAKIPIVRRKMASVMESSGLAPQSHDGKALRRILDTFPRDELFQSSTRELFETVMGVLSMNERAHIRLFMRRDPFGKFVTATVYVPREQFNSSVREQICAHIADAVKAKESDFTTYFSESILARVHFVFRVSPSEPVEFDVARLEAQIVDITRSWEDVFQKSLIESHGEEKGNRLYGIYGRAFPAGYREDFEPRIAVQDVAAIQDLSETNRVAMSFYQPVGAPAGSLRFKVFNWGSGLTLSDVIPVLENLGLKVMGEFPYTIRPAGRTDVWMHEFYLEFGLPTRIDAQASRNLFQDAFAAIWSNVAESDAFNRLVLAARLNWREVSMLRAYARYLKQTKFSASQGYIAATLANHVEITRNLVALFRAMFDPRISAGKGDQTRVERLIKKIHEGLDGVDNLNEDQVIRRYLDLILATLRTNFFQSGSDGEPKDYISIKFSPRDIPGIPEPRPEFEIFVYSPRVEGVHLRGGKVARGGLRWSDRHEDFRTEILGLVKAQNVKNAVIVPSGAKGGFVVRRPPADGSREAMMAEGIACYKTFIRGLLDITDNLKGGEVLPPEQVVRRDDDDPYLVVAADKGTATFSDIANGIAAEYDFWLGDAFASGGSQGYDHKKMGITARGAWVSVQRHFREMGINVQEQDFSVIGIGDMAGDVFGNGMLLSEHICLKAAFNHMHIFIDPNPDAATSFAERKRLFELPRSTWMDYNRELISKGGGIFDRRAKSIRITPEMKEAFAIEADQLNPNELISALLRAPVDLIWNGGIGTYVKASSETHAEVGDKSNDHLRVDGRELRAKVFGEGGNLGMTQRGRIEFALNGGRCNTDFIDNAAGVDCSDHEVNIKILLNKVVTNGDLTDKQRNQLLEEMTDSVSELVLHNNYDQTCALSVAEYQVAARLDEYRRTINDLESEGRLNRALEFIPDNEQITERHNKGQHLTRPELSVLISYVKVKLKEELLHAEVIDNPQVQEAVESAFPAELVARYREMVYDHPLRRQIVATQVANEMVNSLGITFYHRIASATGADVNAVAAAYISARDVYLMPEFQRQVAALDYKVPAELQIELLSSMIGRVRRATRWFIRSRRNDLEPAQNRELFQEPVQRVIRALPEVLSGAPRRDWEARYQELLEANVPEQIALLAASPTHLYSALGIAVSARAAERPVEEVASIYFRLADALDLHWFGTQITGMPVESYWQAQARETSMDDLDSQLSTLAVNLLRLAGEAGLDVDGAMSRWSVIMAPAIQRWNSLVSELKAAPAADFAMFTVALRELMYLANATADQETLAE
ncbi:NAD-glutamate dehydrogenase [Microbulbifer thermotolerans]|uniref:NAD-glutamate dehydrogenase n=2 Tax=Microbulbifer thermotolerans TaxID=252514 RepID=A0AB35HTE8_MICTH|nr:NAD-glutamate dehydrogenase [Microbulbifer thermotolerans]MCX2779811.1 NAD-glutamate dehydrogenase [Microbulbifer thermotolerans]MCX2784418.1 NAD-glutamate dehydrogenase [Microbulbifer thermotolerans]MCX2794479.1 NAD-glutamate dehydrogenase [Microbulbifer thermotolerans]MCX2800410.1 NAD-glutamate dehydrogenase [Microbulbifer thermotolerans]MCX2805017.1 NAD-glutamate dehydrogenase [Microbulbifer thermotolerans]